MPKMKEEKLSEASSTSYLMFRKSAINSAWPSINSLQILGILKGRIKLTVYLKCTTSVLRNHVIIHLFWNRKVKYPGEMLYVNKLKFSHLAHFYGKLQGAQDMMVSTVFALKVRLEGEGWKPDKLTQNCDKDQDCCLWDPVQGPEAEGEKGFLMTNSCTLMLEMSLEAPYGW